MLRQKIQHAIWLVPTFYNLSIPYFLPSGCSPFKQHHITAGHTFYRLHGKDSMNTSHKLMCNARIYHHTTQLQRSVQEGLEDGEELTVVFKQHPRLCSYPDGAGTWGWWGSETGPLFATLEDIQICQKSSVHNELASASNAWSQDEHFLQVTTPGSPFLEKIIHKS